MALVKLKRKDNIAQLKLTRPKVLNILSIDLIKELSRHFKVFSDDPYIRAVILTGEGWVPCVVVDLKELVVLPNAADHFEWHGANSLMDIMRACPRPIIGAINVFAITGIKLALWCGFLIAAKSARFGDTHARVGIIQSWGLAQLLPRVVGISGAKQMSLIGEMTGTKTAQAWG